MPKKLFVFGFLFIFLAGVSLFLIFKGKPKEASEPLLMSMGASKISKIEIQEPAGSLTLEKKDGLWRLTAPVQDVADPEAMDQLTGSLTSFSIGSVISEKKEKYASFDLDEGKATHFKVYQFEKEKPVLDAYLGKQAISYGTSYFRYADQDPVYIAENLPNWVLLKPANEIRLKKVLPAQRGNITQFSAATGSFQVSFNHVGSTWTLASNGNFVEPSTVEPILEKALSLEARAFEDTLDPKVSYGFEKPYLSFSVDSTSGPVKAVIGNKKLAKKGETFQDVRYARTEGRSTVLLIITPLVEELASQLKNLPAAYKK